MPRSSRSSASATSVRLRFVFRSIVQPIARLEQRLLAYWRDTTPRRRIARAGRVLLLTGMSICMMGNYGCGPCETLVFVFQALQGIGNSIHHSKAAINGTDGSQTGTASFAGNFAAITQPPQNYFVMQRQTDCSLNLIVGNSTLNGSATATANTPHYEQTLHQLASLKTTPNVFAKGCVEKNTGLSSRIGVWVGNTQQNVGVFASAAGRGSSNAVFSLTVSQDFSSIKFNTESSLTAASALATADLNGDGNGDLVVVNGYVPTSAFISIMLGNADGTFKTPVSYPIGGTRSVAAVIEDVNGDGKLDIVAVSDDQQISVLLGKGDGTFSPAQSFAAPTLPGYTSSSATPITNLITADVNGDGKKDVICSNGLVLLGKGDGTFTATAAPAFPYTPGSTSAGPFLAAGDLNNDGKLDIVLNTGYVISTWMGKGDGSFTRGGSYAGVNNTGYVTVSDLDGDGNADIYTGLANGGLFSGDDSSPASAYVLMGNGDGTFQGAGGTNGGAYTGNNLGDVNGDGVPDLITNGVDAFNTPIASFTVQLGTGKGTFANASTITPPASFVLNGTTLSNGTLTTYAVGDINGDGKADLVFVMSGFTAVPIPNSGFFVYTGPVYFTALSNGDGTFQTPVPHIIPQIAPSTGFDITTLVSGLQIGDFNKDGRNDLILTFNDNAGGPGVTNPYLEGFMVLPGIGNGSFGPPVLTSTYSSTVAPTNALVPQVVNTVDLNGDGKTDLIVNNTTFTIGTGKVSQLQVFVGNGDGTFKTPINLTAATNVYGIPVLADLNKDGKLDLAYLAENSSSQAQIAISLGNGDGTFAAPTLINVPGGDSIRGGGIAAADFDGDGKIDVAMLSGNSISGVFYGKGDGSFISVPNGNLYPKDLINLYVGGPAIAVDLNKDSKPDILVGSTILANAYGAAPVVTAFTTTVLTSSASTITTGASITFTATITPIAGSTGSPTGTVTFYDGTTILGTGPVASGVATYATNGLTTGTHSITVVYPGDVNFSTSTSRALAITVNAIPVIVTTTTLSTSATSAVLGTGLTFTATVTPAAGTAIPSGTVTFSDGGTALGTGTLDANGKATYSTSTLALGAHSITAAFPGTITFAGSTSSGLAITISAAASPDFGLSLSPASTTVTHGTAATTALTLTPSAGFTASTSILCTGAPAHSLCMASPTIITPIGGGAATTTVTLQTSVTSASLGRSLQRYSLAGLPLGLLSAFMLFALIPGRRRLGTLMVATVMTACLLAATGCGGKASGSAPVTAAPGTYTLTIVGASGAISHFATWTVTVQ